LESPLNFPSTKKVSKNQITNWNCGCVPKIPKFHIWNSRSFGGLIHIFFIILEARSQGKKLEIYPSSNLIKTNKNINFLNKIWKDLRWIWILWNMVVKVDIWGHTNRLNVQVQQSDTGILFVLPTRMQDYPWTVNTRLLGHELVHVDGLGSAQT
jgi:hypothetical protein